MAIVKHGDSGEFNRRYHKSLDCTVQDKRISTNARCIIWYLESKPADWDINQDDIVASIGISKDLVKKAFRELKAYGYIYTEKKGLGYQGGVVTTHTLYQYPPDNPNHYENSYNLSIGEYTKRKSVLSKNTQVSTPSKIHLMEKSSDDYSSHKYTTEFGHENKPDTEQTRKNTTERREENTTEGEGIQSPLGASSPLQEKREEPECTNSEDLYIGFTPGDILYQVTDEPGTYNLYGCDIPKCMINPSIISDLAFVSKWARLLSDDIDSLGIAYVIESVPTRIVVFPKGLPQRFKDAIDITTIPKALSVAA